MKKILFIILVVLYSSSLMAQDYSQSPYRENIRNSKNRQVQTQVAMGAGFSKDGSSEYVASNIGFQPDKRWQVSVGVGMMFSNLKAPVFSQYSEYPDYQNLRAITNYYHVSANYLATEKLLLSGSIIYGQNRFTNGGIHNSSNNDSYVCTFGATYQITPSLSIGFEVSQYRNMYPYYGYYYPHGRF